MASPAACPGRCADPRVEQAEFVALAAVLGLIDRNLSERATRERVLVRRGGLITEPALHQKARLEPGRRDAVELDRAAAGQRQQDIAVARRSAPG